MQLRVTGKNIDVGDVLRAQIEERLSRALEKYFTRGWSAQVVVERERAGFRTDCQVHLDSGIDLQSRGFAADAYLSFDQAADRLEKRLRRYNRRLKDHRAEAAETSGLTDYTIAWSESEEEPETVDDNPVVIAESRADLRHMTVSMAVMALDLADAPVLVFRNVATGRLNVVYRRPDGNIGWIDPTAGEKEARG